MSPPTQVVRAALGHPAVHAPCVDVAVDDLGELNGGGEGHEGIESAERVPARQVRIFSDHMSITHGDKTIPAVQ